MQDRRSLNVFNCIFFSAATSLALAMAAPAWRYGFFFTPFPALFTALFLVYLTCLVFSIVDSFKPQTWLGLPMRDIVGAAGGLRLLALLAPIPMIAYFSMMFFVESNFDCCPTHLAWAQRMIGVDGYLFGHRRAEGWRSQFADKAYDLGRLDLSELYLIANLQSTAANTADRNRITVPVVKLAQLHMRMNRGELAKFELTHQINAYLDENGTSQSLSRNDKLNLAVLRSSLACAYDTYGDYGTADELYAQAEETVNDPTMRVRRHRKRLGAHRHGQRGHLIAAGHLWEVLSSAPIADLENQAHWMVQFRDPSAWDKHPVPVPMEENSGITNSAVYPALCGQYVLVNNDDYAFLMKESEMLRAESNTDKRGCVFVVDAQ